MFNIMAPDDQVTQETRVSSAMVSSIGVEVGAQARLTG